jgi:hypothetical protein
MKFREAFPDVDIDRFHIETEERVRKFHSALYELVVDKYGEFLARKLLRMPAHKDGHEKAGQCPSVI